jgi:ribonuclease-3
VSRSDAQLEQLQRALEYQFRDASLLALALTHRSKGSRNNERLEFLGDSILGFVVADMLYSQFSSSPEGHLSRFRSSLVKKETLAELAREFSLGDYLFLGSGELKSGGFRRDSILADAMEAIIGAIYLDSGMDNARQLIEKCLGPRTAELSAENELKDPKTRLQEYLQAQHLSLPVYAVVNTSGDEHNQRFEVTCKVQGLEEAAIGIGSSRRKAEQAAAEQALQMLANGEE